MSDQLSRLKEKAKALPHQSGVYLFKNASGRVIYVGKARDLKKRVAAYFRTPAPDPKILALQRQAASLEYIVCANEPEALFLESNLIKKYRPRYNVAWRDDKQYPYLKLTAKEIWPRLLLVRRVENDGARYFGPFEGKEIRRSLGLIRRLFPIRSCSESPLRRRKQPCLHYHMQRCLAPCAFEVSHKTYLSLCRGIAGLLSGKPSLLTQTVRRQMQSAADRQDFETAAKLRDALFTLERISAKQKAGLPKEDAAAGRLPLQALQRTLNLARPPRRIEAFDVSNLQGSNMVAALVTFFDGLPKKEHYRKFKIRTQKRPNDVGAIFEAVYRRFMGSLLSQLPDPDLILIDGGAGQRRAAQKALDESKKGHLPLVALAKRQEEVFYAPAAPPLKLARNHPALMLLQRLRDEAHRFAITYHRKKRSLFA